MANQDLSGRNAARERRNAQIYGKAALPSKTSAGTRASVASSPKPVEKVVSSSGAAPTARAISSPSNSGREASRARRLAMSSKGKTGIAISDRQRTEDARRAARAVEQKQDCGCGCNGAGDCGDAKPMPTVAMALSSASSTSRRNEIKTVDPSSAGRINSRLRRQALSAHGKTGIDAFRKGVSSAQMVRQQNPDISGRDLARTVRNQRSTNGGAATASTGRSAPAGRRRPERGNGVTGTKVAHSDKTTGDETGLCRTITGTDYFSSEVFAEFCQKEVPAVPAKVAATKSLAGSTVTASGRVGRSEKVTGDERGSCRTVTGSEYVGREQYDNFCAAKPEPGSAKVSFSQTTRGQIVSGSKPARSRQVTGNEAGTCKAVTGTPYAGVEQYADYCEPAESKLADARSQRRAGGNVGRDITGLQPGLAGLTGAERGACRDISGTAYISGDQFQTVCGVAPAQAGESDFPRAMGDAPWGAFSVVAPAQASQKSARNGNVTGTSYEQGRISGTFAMGEGKVTGTEQFRFGSGKASRSTPVVADANANANIKRVTGEGMETGLKITGDDWNRGNHVTGTEGMSAAKRNPTRRGPISAMPALAPKRNEEVERAVTKVTGGTGTAEKGAIVTLSGGARG